MARKKKACLTRKKSKKPMDDDEPAGMSAREFATLANGYGSFITKDADGKQVTFSEGDVAYIQHQELGDAVVVPEEDYWIGKIEEIRGDNADDVWVRVQWFWSPQEVAEVVSSFNPAICGRREKLSSNNFDVISVYAFVCHVDVKLFDETSIYQASISEDEWFTRFNFLYFQRRISPKVTHDACSICMVPYTPGVEKILHYCPRPSCRRLYHQSCLVMRGYVNETLAHSLLETWPDIDRTLSVKDFCRGGSAQRGCDPAPPRVDEPPRKRRKRDPPSELTLKRSEDNDPLASLPPLLVAVAEQRIVRGTRGGGVVGNIRPVTTARHLIFEALHDGGVVPDDWETVVDVSEAFPLAETDGTLPNCLCPSCYSPI